MRSKIPQFTNRQKCNYIDIAALNDYIPAGTQVALLASMMRRFKPRRKTMRAKWLIGIGLSVFLAAPFALAQEPEGEAAQQQIKKQEKKQDQQKLQEQLKKQEQLKAQEQKRNRHRHRKGKGDAQGDMNAGGGGSGDAEGSSGSSEQIVNPADDTQLIDQDGDGINDNEQVGSQNQGEKGDGEKGAMKRGRHRYRHRKAVGTATQKGAGTQKRAGKGFGEGFVDGDGNGVSDNYQGRKGK
jgi:hypothetical protein